MDLLKLNRRLQSDEGEVKMAGRHVVYQDHLGYDTIGYGRLLSRGLSQGEAEFLLANDINDSVKVLDRNIPWWRSLPESAARGLANMSFQLGWPRLSGFKRMLVALEDGNRRLAATESLNSKWARQTPERANRVADLIRGEAR